MLTEEFSVTINEGGSERTGVFKVKLKLTYREMMGMDATRRQLLGPNSQEADRIVELVAVKVAQLRAHIVTSPSWWKDFEEGMAFENIESIITISDALEKVQKTYLDGLKKAADKAQTELKAELK